MVRTWQRFLGAMLIFTAALVLPSHAAPPPVALSGTDLEAALVQDNAASSCRAYRFRGWLRRKVVRECDLACYGLQLEDDWDRAAAADKPVVLLVHGFNSCPQNNDAVMGPIRAAGFPCGSFAYPNDHTIPASAQLLSSDLERFAERYPERRVVLVCHSMGGMVARACLEDSFYDPGNVERLIMIAPPTHGTLLAHFAVGSDLWEHWLARREGKPWTRWRDSVVDGLGEAADDLVPDSDFLHDLNARPLNPQVRYSIILGSDALMSEPQMNWIRESVCDQLAKLPGGDGSADRLNSILSDIDELVEGKGDGVVAVKRGRLDGVSDTIVLPFGHLAVTGEADNDTLRAVHQEVLVRVQ